MTDVNREARRTIAAESPLNPMSLCGSYAVSPEGKVALVVGEPQPGVYLVEFYNIADEPEGQAILTVQRLAEEGFTFYDSRAEVTQALRAMFR